MITMARTLLGEKTFEILKMLKKDSIKGKTTKTRAVQENLLCLLKAHRVVVPSCIENLPKSNNYKIQILTKMKSNSVFCRHNCMRNGYC